MKPYCKKSLKTRLLESGFSKRFVIFGSAIVGVFGIFIVIRVIKLVIDTIIHGYALHTLYGCSLHLFEAIWSSLTHLLLHLARGPTNKKNKRNSTDNGDPRHPSARIIPKAPRKIISTPALCKYKFVTYHP